MELTLKERKKLTRVTAGRYRKAAKREKTAILDTFVEQTGYGRKYAIHLRGEVLERLREKHCHMVFARLCKHS